LPETLTGFWERLRFFDAKVGYGLNDSRFGTTTDGGYHWQFSDDALVSALKPRALLFLNQRIGWLGAGGGEKNAPSLLRTTDGGATWQQGEVPANLRGYPSDLFFVDADHGWVILWNGFNTATSTLLRTDDGGRTWSEDTSWIAAARGQVIQQVRFVSSNLGLLTSRSRDIETLSGVEPCGDSNALSLRQPSTLLVTLDGGRTWRRSELAEPTGSCQVMEGNVWCTSGRDLLKIRIRP
jgi:photosystem II stability/assembly factor-like uncharacterized protein